MSESGFGTVEWLNDPRDREEKKRFIVYWGLVYQEFGLPIVPTRRQANEAIPTLKYTEQTNKEQNKNDIRTLCKHYRAEDGYGISIRNGIVNGFTIATVDCDSPTALKNAIETANRRMRPELLDSLVTEGRKGHAKIIYAIDEDIHLKGHTQISANSDGVVELLGHNSLSMVPPSRNFERRLNYKWIRLVPQKDGTRLLHIKRADLIFLLENIFSMDDWTRAVDDSTPGTSSAVAAHTTDLDTDSANRIACMVRPFIRAHHRDHIAFSLVNLLVKHSVRDERILSVLNAAFIDVRNSSEWSSKIKEKLKTARKNVLNHKRIGGASRLTKALSDAAAEYQVPLEAESVVSDILNLLPPLKKAAEKDTKTTPRDDICNVSKPDNDCKTVEETVPEVGHADSPELEPPDRDVRSLLGKLRAVATKKKLPGNIIIHSHIPEELIREALRSEEPAVLAYLRRLVKKCNTCEAVITSVENEESITKDPSIAEYVLQNPVPDACLPPAPSGGKRPSTKPKKLKRLKQPAKDNFEQRRQRQIIETRSYIESLHGNADSVAEAFNLQASSPHRRSRFTVPDRLMNNGSIERFRARLLRHDGMRDKAIFDAMETASDSTFGSFDGSGLCTFSPPAFQSLKCDAHVNGNDCPGGAWKPTSTTDHLDPINAAWLAAQYLKRRESWFSSNAWNIGSYCREIRVPRYAEMSDSQIREGERLFDGIAIHNDGEIGDAVIAGIHTDTRNKLIAYASALASAKHLRTGVEKHLRESGLGGICMTILSPYAVWIVLLTNLPYDGHHGKKLPPGLWRPILFIPKHPELWVDAVYRTGYFDQDIIRSPIPFLEAWDPEIRRYISGWDEGNTHFAGLVYANKLLTSFGACKADKMSPGVCPHKIQHDNGEPGKFIPLSLSSASEEGAIADVVTRHDDTVCSDGTLWVANCKLCVGLVPDGHDENANADFKTSGPGPPAAPEISAD